MKNLLLILIFLFSTLHANENLRLFSQYKNGKVYLKWLVGDYSSKNVYKLYKVDNGNKELIYTSKVKSIEEIKKIYDSEILTMFYPYSLAKTKEDKVEVAKSESMINAFRLLQVTQNNTFAEDMGVYFVDKNVNSQKSYEYEVEQYRDEKLISKANKIVSTDEDNVFSGIVFFQGKDSIEGAYLSWGIGSISAYYNIYRKMKSDNKFYRINTKPLYISSNSKSSEKMYIDSTLKEGEEAQYYIKKINVFGWENPPTKIITAKRLKKDLSKRVNKLFVKADNEKITLRWMALENAKSYNVYRGNTTKTEFVKINKQPILKEVYFDRDFKQNRNHYYYITFIDKENKESLPSSKMLAYSRDAKEPNIPTNLSFKIDKGEIKFEWDENSDKDLLGYRLFMSMDSNPTEWSMINKTDIKTNNYIHKRSEKLSANNYYYHIKAVDNSFNESAMSNIVKVKLPDVTPPIQPNITSHNVYNNKLKFKWNKIDELDLSHFNIYTQLGTNLVKLNDEPLKTNMFEYKFDKNSINGTKKYLVTAVDKSGNESSKTSHIVVNHLDLTAVDLKTIFYEKDKKNNSLVISFTIEDKDYSGFEVYRSYGKIKGYQNISGFKKGYKYVDNSLSKGLKYWYKLKFFDKSGNIKTSRVKEIKW